MPNTCKSNGVLAPSGERVSNTYLIYLLVGDNSWKRLLIPHTTSLWHQKKLKGPFGSLEDEDAAY